MNKLFFDANVVLDLLLDRNPFSNDIATIIEHSIKNSITISVSSITISNLNYIIGKLENSKNAKKKTEKILELVYVENVGDSIIRKALKSTFTNFEDGIQYFSAKESNHKIIITKNIKDFKESDLSIMTPKEYLAKIT